MGLKYISAEAKGRNGSPSLCVLFRLFDFAVKYMFFTHQFRLGLFKVNTRDKLKPKRISPFDH
jgi:hypothetical protein